MVVPCCECPAQRLCRFHAHGAAPLSGRARAQVAYARWLISFGMELEDKKVRPRGSPPREGVLADLAQQLCAFPAHAPTCKFATFYRCAPIPPCFVKFIVCKLNEDHKGLL